MAVATLVLINALKLFWDAHYLDGYEPGAPLNVAIRADEMREGFRRVYFTYEGVDGEPVPALLALPKSGGGPFPVLVFLHGIGQDKEFLDKIAAPFAKEGFAAATFDQSMQGERKLRTENPAKWVMALRRRGTLTIHEARRLVDYLETRDDIAKDRIYLIGASYGAITGATAAAVDPRFRAVMLTYGGGDFGKIVDNGEVRNAAGSLTPVAAFVSAWFMAPCDPLLYVDGIAPRPILFQNGERDRIITPAAARALHNAAGEPKDIVWYPSDHLDLDPEYIPIALRDGIEWIKNKDRELQAEGTAGS